MASLQFNCKQTSNMEEDSALEELTQDTMYEDDTSGGATCSIQPVVTPSTNCKSNSEITPKKACDFADKMKHSAPKSGISRLAAMQAERYDVQTKKLEFEKLKYEEEKELKEKQLKLKEDKFYVERARQERMLEIEETKLRFEQENKREERKLKEMELEMKERIARYELELKYKK